jgi:hypothetical protein
MHASIEELLSLRDGEPGAERAAAHLASCAQCRAELEQLRHVRAGLAALPEIEPARSSWAGIMQRATAPPPRTREWRIAAGAGIAASAVLAAALLVRAGGGGAPEPAATVVATPAPEAAAPVESAPAVAALDTQALVERSRRLEARLALLRPEPEVVNVGTAVTIATLQDQLALVDYRLSLGVEDPLAPEQSRRLWQQRVDLMDSLVSVRYAQLQRAAY